MAGDSTKTPVATWPMDDIERRIPDVAAAEEYLSGRDVRVLQKIRERHAEVINEFGAGVAELPQTGYRVSVVCLARMSLRHGSDAERQRDYHNEGHLLDVLDQMRHISRYQPEQRLHSEPLPDEGTGLRRLGPLSSLCLAVFAAAHDIRQSEIGYDDDGVGHNERASADECMRILMIAGLDYDRHRHIFQLLRWMIHGSTFYTTTQSFDVLCVQPGALAPVIASQIIERGQSIGQLSAAEAADLILLASDIDTANVAEPIDEYARQSVRMCREANRHRDLKGGDQLASHAVFEFLTSGQEQYFFRQQRFYSQLAQNAFTAAKGETGEHLKRLIQSMRDNYTADDLPDGETLMREFLERARRLRAGQTRHQDSD